MEEHFLSNTGVKEINHYALYHSCIAEGYLIAINRINEQDTPMTFGTRVFKREAAHNIIDGEGGCSKGFNVVHQAYLDRLAG